MAAEDEYQRVKVKLRDAAGPRSAYYGIKKSALDATGNYLFSMTLGLHFPPDEGTRSAVYVVIDGRYFVVTASHLLDRNRITDIWAVPRPQSPVVQVSNPKTSPVRTVRPGRQFKLPVEGMKFESDPIDLLVIRVRPLPHLDGYLRPHDLSDRRPPPLRKEQAVNIIGFPDDYARITKKPNNAGLQRRLSMYLHVTERAKETGAIAGYDRKLHLLLNLNSTRNAPTRVDPHGLSGGSVWRFKPARSRREIWTPSSEELLGILTGFYPRAKLLKATRIEEAVRLAHGLM